MVAWKEYTKIHGLCIIKILLDLCSNTWNENQGFVSSMCVGIMPDLSYC
jgi:hypothetical protein